MSSNQARVDIAKAEREDNGGDAERRGKQSWEIDKTLAGIAVQKTERGTEKVQAEAILATRQHLMETAA